MVDDHPVICQAVADALHHTIGVDLLGYATGFREGLSEIQQQPPDVAIVDISLPDGHGLDLVRTINRQNPDVGILIFSMYDEKIYAERALRTGASGYLMKTEPVEWIVEAIRCIERGETFLSDRMTNRIVRRMRQNGSAEARFSVDELTDREREVFRMIGRGYSVEKVQDELGLSRKTVETHRRRAREKLGLDSISALLQYAMQWMYCESKGLNGER
ncbi:response regulator transcription factor [Salinibacter sp. 10B]|uniref:response regulator transcription factor n=1 Tax=Salinibacter sp. 10B TaxID=1923971 RepID=UPI002157594E|nr:response regulator transcription factor [Salinibacter sp. 10B]